ncbi:hypothetical protein ACLOJK_010966 [Asimina triloba]
MVDYSTSSVKAERVELMNFQLSGSDQMRKQDNHRIHFGKDNIPSSELWKDGLVCAFEFVRGGRKTRQSKSTSKPHSFQQRESSISRKPVLRSGQTNNAAMESMNEHGLLDSTFPVELNTAPPIFGTDDTTPLDDHKDNDSCFSESFQGVDNFPESHWVPIGWARISELVQTVQVDASWGSQPTEFADNEDDLTVADVAAPYWERPAGPTWWCHVAPGHPTVDAWLSNAQWLHPAISIALRDESRLISERMKHLLYEVPVRVAGGLLFELLGQSAGDPFTGEDDIPIVLRSWQAQNFLITSLHIKGSPSNVNVLGITEVQELKIMKHIAR